MMTIALTNLANVEAKVRFLSIEPHLGFITMKSHPIKGIIDWIIDGALTGRNYWDLAAQLLPTGEGQDRIIRYGKMWTLQPKIEWVEEISKACVNAGIPLFLKDNLLPLLDPRHIVVRQEMPETK